MKQPFCRSTDAMATAHTLGLFFSWRLGPVEMKAQESKVEQQLRRRRSCALEPLWRKFCGSAVI